MKVAQKFGKRGVFTGEITAYSAVDDLYTVSYTEGDAEEFDEAEYLAAVHLFRVNKRNKEEAEDSANLSSVEEDASPSEAELSSDSSDDKPKARQRKPHKKKLPPDNISSVTNTSVAGKEMATMSASAIHDVNLKLEGRLKKVKNKEVKACVLQEKYQDILEDHTRRQLQ
jgi:hypothetical protein